MRRNLPQILCDRQAGRYTFLEMRLYSFVKNVTNYRHAHIHTERRMPQRPADVQMQSHILSAKVVSNCSQAIQVCLNVNE